MRARFHGTQGGLRLIIGTRLFGCGKFYGFIGLSGFSAATNTLAANGELIIRAPFHVAFSFVCHSNYTLSALFFSVYLDTFSTMPMEARNAAREVPPELMNGSVWPVAGIIPETTATLMMT